MMRVLSAARTCAPPDWWIGGGVLRDLVWDGLHGDFDPARVKDVDLAFYDPLDLSHAHEEYQRRLLDKGVAQRWPKVVIEP